MSKLCIRLAVLLCFLLTAGTAAAEGFALYEYGARGLALGGAMVARKPDASAVAYNPALLTRLPGIHIMGGLTTISPSGTMDWTDSDGTRGSTSLRESLWAIPHIYYTHQINDDFFFGIGEFSRYGLGFEYPHNWPGRFNIYEVSLLSASLNPVLAWKATDKLSLAAGVEIVYVNLDLKKRVGVDVPGLTSFEVDSNIQNANDVGVGFNLGTHYQFNDQWAVGLHYRSQVRVHAHGDVEFTNLNPEAPYSNIIFNQQFHDGTAHATVILPDSFAGGISWTPIPELSIEAGAIWTRWSEFRSLNINLPGKMANDKSHNPKHWKDVWRLNLGVEYDLTDWMALRGGLVWDQSPMTSKYEDYLVPTRDRWIYSAGVGLHWDAWTVDLAYALIRPKNRSYGADNETHTLKSRTRDSQTHLFSVSLGYAF